jgi:ubiquinone/menaquinone biosynthesis C-methylase UbiE
MKIEPGSSTAFPFNIEYRLGRISKYVKGGDWLDFGCADGGYSEGLLGLGADSVIGVDAEADRIVEARQRHPDITFYSYDDEHVFPDNSFDGVFMNEVFEHVQDGDETLREVYRMLRPGGVLALITPNRGFPFEGHTMHIGSWTSKRPLPIVPWLPRALTDSWVTARNFWPNELRDQMVDHGFGIIEAGFIMPVFEEYTWVPARLTELFRSRITTIDRLPVIARLGVSNLVVGRK